MKVRKCKKKKKFFIDLTKYSLHTFETIQKYFLTVR